MAHSNPVEFDGVKLYVDWTKPGSYTAQEILTGAKSGGNHGEPLAVSMGKIAEWHDWLVPSGGQNNQVLTWDTTYTVTTSQPSDWTTNYKSYYTKSGDNYIPVTGDSAPTWAANTYYRFAAGTKPYKWATPTVNVANLTGTLPVSKGGTGQTTLTSNAILAGNGTAIKQITTSKGAAYASSTNGALTFGTLNVEYGGTGQTSFTSNAIITGNGTSGLKTVATKAGVLYATATNGVAQFGTLPVAYGGTGQTTKEGARSNLEVYSKTETDSAISTALSALGNILRFKGVKTSVDQLPTTGNKIGDVWFVGTNTTAGKDDFTEYVWAQVSSSPDVYEWEYLGKVQVDPDLSDYLTNTALSGAYGTGSKTWVTTLTQSKNGGSATSVGTSTVPTASTNKYGITSLSTATDSSATDVAATPSAVKAAYDLAASKSTVSYTATQTSGTNSYEIGNIVIGGTDNKVYGKKIAYTASQGSSGGTKIGEISQGGTKVADVYAKTVTYSQTIASSATGAYEIGKITLGTSTTTIYGVNTNTTYTGNKGVKLSGTTFSADLKSDTALTDAINVALPTGGTADRLYGVQLDSDGHLAVNVPWTDTTTIPYSDTNPIVAGTASPGTSTNVSRADHVHPAQTSVSGNAGTATKLATARAIDGVKFNGSANIKHFGECSTAAATAAKTVNVDATNSNFVLETGAAVIVKFTTTNTAAVANLTLSVNGSTAKSIKYRGANLPSANVLSSGRIYKFVYDGTYWQLVGDLDTNTTYGVVTKTANGLVGAPGNSPVGKYYKVNDSGVPSWIGDPVETDDSLIIHCSA